MRTPLIRMASKALALGAALFLGAPMAQAADLPKVELVNPAGVVAVKKVDAIPHNGSLDGKRIVLRWNGKPNGEIYLDRIADLLEAKYKKATVIRAYKENPKTAIGAKEDIIVGGTEGQTKMVMAMGPDIVIAAQAD